VDKNEAYQEELRKRHARQKELDAIVERAMSQVASQIAGRQPSLHSRFFYGASAIHAKHLVTWYLFRTDSELATAKRNGLTAEIESATREQLAASGYPSEGVNVMMVSFTTDQDIRNKTGGDYWSYFK